MDNKASEIYAEISRLSKVSANLSEESKKLKSDISKLYILLGEMNGCWNGSAQRAFSASFGETCTKLDNAASCVSKTAEDFNFALKVYSACEQDALDIVNVIKI